MQEELLLRLRLGVAGHHEPPPVGGRETNIQHFDSAKVFQHRSWRQPRSQRLEPDLQSDQQAVGRDTEPYPSVPRSDTV